MIEWIKILRGNTMCISMEIALENINKKLASNGIRQADKTTRALSQWSEKQTDNSRQASEQKRLLVKGFFVR